MKSLTLQEAERFLSLPVEEQEKILKLLEEILAKLEAKEQEEKKQS